MIDKLMLNVWIATICAFAVGIAAGFFLIPVLIRLKFGQEIREIGPKWHKKKAGTPTMGGVIFIIAALLTTLVFDRDKNSIFIVCTAFSFGLVGFADDFIKIAMKRNLGLTERQKLILQILAASLAAVVGVKTGVLSYEVIVPFTKWRLNLWHFYIPFAVFVMVGGTNSVNLTDGLDGLAASVTTVVSIFFTVMAYKFGDESITIFCASLTGALLAFLVFNAYPAKVFMGDTGSLFLGGAVCGAALVLKLPLILVFAGGIYIIETLSVIIQVTSFKLTGKRVFKMSPIHHHFEMSGFSERKIVVMFILASLVFCVISYFMVV